MKYQYLDNFHNFERNNLQVILKEITTIIFAVFLTEMNQ